MTIVVLLAIGSHVWLVVKLMSTQPEFSVGFVTFVVPHVGVIHSFVLLGTRLVPPALVAQLLAMPLAYVAVPAVLSLTAIEPSPPASVTDHAVPALLL